MKKLINLLFISFLLIASQSKAQDSFRMRLLSSFNNPDLPKVDGTDIWNDLTGYYDPKTKREYIICGSTDSIYFFDITDPKSMKLVDVESGKSFFATNRDFETYRHYVYCVADQYSGVGALQVFDLSYLPDSVHKVYEGGSNGLRTHTIFIDTASARMYMSSNLKPTGLAAMDIISLSDPENPTYLCELKVPTRPDGFPMFNLVHEMYARHDTVYLCCGNAGLFIFDVRDTGSQRLIGTITSYPDQGYCHSSWLDKSGKYLMFTDENMSLDVKIFDIHSLANPQLMSTFNSNEQAMPHNAYWFGDFAYVSSYHDGVRVYNIKDPGNPQMVAWYDTHPVSPEVYGGYKGCWGVYPFLPSGHIIASDLTSGIFVFEIDSQLLSTPDVTKLEQHFSVYPNPTTQQVKISCTQKLEQIRIYDAKGIEMMLIENPMQIMEIDLNKLAQGIYFIEAKGASKVFTQKLIKCD